MDYEYKLAEVCNILKMKTGRLQNWLFAKWVVPSIEEAAGSGTRNIFSADDIVVVELLRQMVDIGIPRRLAGEISRYYQTHTLYSNSLQFLIRDPFAYFQLYVFEDDRFESNIATSPDGIKDDIENKKPLYYYGIDLTDIWKKIKPHIK